MINPFLLRRELDFQLKQIPKKNKAKFQVDLYKLIQEAQGSDYENFNF